MLADYRAACRILGASARANKRRDESPARDEGADMIASPASDAHKAKLERLRRDAAEPR